MSPPDVNLEKQKRRHWLVLVGIIGAIAVAVIAWAVIATLVENLPEDTNPTVMEDEVAE